MNEQRTGTTPRGFREQLQPTYPVRRSAGTFSDDGTDEQPFKTLTADEAQRVREKLTFVSPWRVVVVQLFAGLACALVIGLLWREASMVWSALYGVAATVLPSALLARGMTRGVAGAVTATAGFLFWELLKIGTAIAMLLIASRVVPQLSWPALLLTMVVCMKVNWFALLWRGR